MRDERMRIMQQRHRERPKPDGDEDARDLETDSHPAAQAMME